MFRELWCAGATRRYWWSSFALMLLYSLTIFLALKIAPAAGPSLWRTFSALSPLLPLGGFVYLEYQRIRATDELRQRMELEACMMALVVGILLLTAWGLLGNAGLVPVNPLLAAPLLVATYALAQFCAYWRYQ
ncbi:MAG: hypothetical protein ABIO49_08790 [Dokdonella sp.]